MAKSPLTILRRMPAFAPILAKKPGIARQYSKAWYQEKVRKRHVIKALEVGVTYACQASCDKCSADRLLPPRGSERKRLDLAGFQRVADGAYDHGCYEVNFTGGEPLLAPDLYDIIPLFHPRRTFLGINTNGEMLDRKKMKELRDLGIDLFKISLDSSVASEHDESRGIPGLFDHIMEVLQTAERMRGVRAHLCTVATRDNVRQGRVQGVLDIAVANDATVGIVFPAPVGGWKGKDDVVLGPDEHRLLQPIADHPSVFYHGNLGADGFRCPCGKDEVYVTCYGDVMPCPFVQVSFGTTEEEGFDAAYERMATHPEIARERTVCMSTEDARFRKLYLDPIEDRPDLPCHIDDHPVTQATG